MDATKLNIIQSHPIGNRLDPIRATLIGLVQNTIDSVRDEDLQNPIDDLISALLGLRASRTLPSKSGRGRLLNDLARLPDPPDFNCEQWRPVLRAVLDRKSDQEIWDQVYTAVTEITPPGSVPYHLQTPRNRRTGSFTDSSGYRKDTDPILKEELKFMCADVPAFHDSFLNRVPGLEEVAAAIFEQCQTEPSPQFRGGVWAGWPEDADQYKVLEWLGKLCDHLAELAKSHGFTSTRRPFSIPDKYTESSTPAKRKLDVGFVADLEIQKDCRPHFSQILILGELKSNPKADAASQAWFDNARYVREVFASQDTRRFVLAFTLCGSRMRVWEFDRIGGIGSEPFDVNQDGVRFVHTVLSFLTLSKEDLGYDATINTAEDGERSIIINPDGKQERLVLDFLISRSPCIAGRATTCWKAHSEADPSKALVVKDSWQYPEREEEGEMLRLATKSGVINVARYYYHETVRVGGEDDDVVSNIRHGINITSIPEPACSPEASRPGPARSSASAKRSSSQAGAPLLPRKRSRPASSNKAIGNAPKNRIHRRVVVRNYGIPIYKAKSRTALLAALEGCIDGHRSLLEANLLHRDISINNLMINEDQDLDWPSFLIDLDHAIDPRRLAASGSKGIIGTQAFMAVGALLGEQHSFMHDLESFFWVLFWICIHFDQSTKKAKKERLFDEWNFMNPIGLAKHKLGTVADEDVFMDTIDEHFTDYFQPLKKWVNKLRRVLFPRDKSRKVEDRQLYSRMKDILRQSREDPEVAE